MHSYAAFGLSIHSDIPLTTFREGSARPDVQVRRGNIACPPEMNGHGRWTTPNDIFFRFENFGLIQISRGREIVVDAGGVDDGIAGLFVMGPAMGALLHQRGLLVLHSSAVTMDGGVAGFLGHSGWGKSTMAAAIVKLGHGAFSDDLLPVLLSNGVPVALPGYPFLKLGQEAGEILGYQDFESTPVSAGDNRRHTLVQGTDPGISVPLARLYVLADGERPEIEPLKPQEAAVELIRYSYASPWLMASGLSTSHLKWCAALVDGLPIRRLRRPRRLELIQDVAALVERDLQERERGEDD